MVDSRASGTEGGHHVVGPGGGPPGRDRSHRDDARLNSRSRDCAVCRIPSDWVFAVITRGNNDNKSGLDCLTAGDSKRVRARGFIRCMPGGNVQHSDVERFSVVAESIAVIDRPFDSTDDIACRATSGRVKHTQVDQARRRSDARVQPLRTLARTADDAGNVSAVSEWIAWHIRPAREIYGFN